MLVTVLVKSFRSDTTRHDMQPVSSRDKFKSCKVIILVSVIVSLNFIKTEKNILRPTLKYPIILDEYMRGLLNVYGVVPDVLPVAPNFTIKVQYTKDTEIEFSRVFFPRDLKHQPALLKWEGPARSFYSILMIGLANPTLDDFNTYEWLHWMVTNTYGTKSSSRNNTLVEYVSPDPKPGMGMYRYIFLVFLQPKKLTFPNKPPLKPSLIDKRRANFSWVRFSKKYGLGKPLGVNFFQSEFWHQNDSRTNFSINDPTPGSYWMTDLEDYIEGSLD